MRVPRLKSFPKALLLVGAIVILLFPSNADAYIDPGAGSMAYQALLVIALGAGVFIRQWYGRAKHFVASFVKREGAEGETAAKR
jgi:hypothetical protein